MSSKIEQIITEIEDYIGECKYQTFSNTNIIVDKEKMEELLRDLRLRTPDEIKRYQKIISNKEAIIQDAREKADAMLAVAQAETAKMVSENQIMQQAYAQAHSYINNAANDASRIVNEALAKEAQILDEANEKAEGIKQAAMEYVYSQLQHMFGIITGAINSAEANYGELIANLKSCEDVIRQDSSHLYPHVGLEKDIAAVEGAYVDPAYQDGGYIADNYNGINYSDPGYAEEGYPDDSNI